MYHELSDRFLVAADVEQTWEFFSTVGNLPAITPPWLRFTLLDADPEIHQDTILKYRIYWMGLPVRWRTRIIDFTPPRQFIDLQLRGPYALWHHQHIFSPHDEGTCCMDRVLYQLPLGILGRAVHALLVHKQLQAIFAYRRKVIGQRLSLVRPLQRIIVRNLW